MVAGNGFYRIVFDDAVQQRQQSLILSFGKRLEIATFQFDADGKGVAAAASAVTGHAGVVGGFVAGYKLQHRTVALDDKMTGYA